MFKSINGLLISVIFSSVLAPSSYAAVGMIREGSTGSTHFRAADALADYFTFSELSAGVSNASINGLNKWIELSDGPFSNGGHGSTNNALDTGSLAASEGTQQNADQVGALKNTDNLFQINKKGLGGTSSEPGTFSSSPASGPETWTMLLVGAMLVAYQLRRKQRGLMALKAVPNAWSN
jgi:hypothetical protein